MSHVPADRVAFWSFDDPAVPTTERDTAATAIAAAALLKLAQVGPEDRRARYRDFAEVAVEALTARHLTARGVLTDACFNKRPDGRPVDSGNRCGLIVGSYYLFESPLAFAGAVDPETPISSS